MRRRTSCRRRFVLASARTAPQLNAVLQRPMPVLASGLILGGLLAIPSHGFAGLARGDEVDAKMLLDRMAQVYAGCRSYRDTGAVSTHYKSTSGSWVDELTFRTAFLRPARFRFEFVDRGRRYIVWKS